MPESKPRGPCKRAEKYNRAALENARRTIGRFEPQGQATKADVAALKRRRMATSDGRHHLTSLQPMTNLSVNLNKVALMRNARGGRRPSVRQAAKACVEAGAQGITLHPRSDGRHALAEDVYELSEWLPVELNVEGNPFAGPAEIGEDAYPGFMEILRRAKPDQTTLVPDSPDQLTSDHGWRLDDATASRLTPVVAELKSLGIRVSLFMDPIPAEIEKAHTLGADRVELYTGPFAQAFAGGSAEKILPKYAAAAEAADNLGIGLNAGHDLDMDNLGLFLRSVPGIREVSIGQALLADSLHLGFSMAVAAYLNIIRSV